MLREDSNLKLKSTLYKTLEKALTENASFRTTFFSKILDLFLIAAKQIKTNQKIVIQHYLITFEKLCSKHKVMNSSDFKMIENNLQKYFELTLESKSVYVKNLNYLHVERLQKSHKSFPSSVTKAINLLQINSNDSKLERRLISEITTANYAKLIEKFHQHERAEMKSSVAFLFVSSLFIYSLINTFVYAVRNQFNTSAFAIVVGISGSGLSAFQLLPFKKTFIDFFKLSLFRFESEKTIEELFGNIFNTSELTQQLTREENTSQEIPIKKDKKEIPFANITPFFENAVKKNENDKSNEESKSVNINNKPDSSITRLPYVFFKKKSRAHHSVLQINWQFSNSNQPIPLDEFAISELVGPGIDPQSKFIVYDPIETPREQQYAFENVAYKETNGTYQATFIPGKAQNRSCVHYLGDDIWSLKVDSNYRILGTTIGENSNNNNKKLIYFYKYVSHQEMKNLLRDSSALKAQLKHFANNKLSRPRIKEL